MLSLVKKTHVSDELHWGMSDHAVGCEFKTNESTVCIR